MKPEQTPADYVTPKLDRDRIARMWQGIEHAHGARPQPRRAATWLAAGAAAVVVSAAAFVLWPGQAAKTSAPRAKKAASGEVIETAGEATTLALPDGSKLSVADATRLAVVSASPSEIRLRLERGSALCDVVPSSERDFVVEARDVRVRVKGTRFAVDVAGERVAVRVERGRVEVADLQGRVHAALSAGQTWSSAPVQQSPIAPAPAPADSDAAPDAGKPRRALVQDPAAEALALFERASSARIAGRARDAAALYDKLRARYPNDPRAGLAAFESARIQLDALGDPKRALEALSFALAQRRAGFVAEDAEALRVDVLARLGDAAACTRARDEFLRAHPRSAHARRVAERCRAR